jgi:hypothetical protein
MAGPRLAPAEERGSATCGIGLVTFGETLCVSADERAWVSKSKCLRIFARNLIWN